MKLVMPIIESFRASCLEKGNLPRYSQHNWTTGDSR